MAANPFRPKQKETYEQQLDLSAPTPKSVEETDELVDVGLSSSHATGAESDQQPKFLESSDSSLLTSGTLGPKVAAPSASGTSAPASGGSSAPSGLFASVCAWLSVEYYQPYFDVSTATVLERMKQAIMPHKNDLFATTAESQPDLYGAVWISLTLVFLIGASSNLNSFFVKSLAQEPWQGDYRILTFASTMVFIYTIVVPFLLWAASLYTGVDPRPALVKMIGIYGYTLVLFIPVSLVCVIPSGAFQWITVLLAAGVSGTVLVRNLYTAFGTSYSALSQTDAEAQMATEENPTTSRTKTSVLLITGAAVLHGVFSLMLKLFFFQGGELASAITNNSGSNGK